MSDCDSSFLFNTLYSITSSLASSLDEQEVLFNIMKLVGDIFHPENWSLLLYDKQNNTLVFKFVVGAEARHLEGLAFPADKGVAGWVLQHKKHLLIPDAVHDSRVWQSPSDNGSFVTKSVIAFPLYSQNIPIGVIELINVPVEAFSKEKTQILQLLSDFASIALQHSSYVKIMEKKTILDQLTELYNAEYMYVILKKEASRFSRTAIPFSLLFFDLDHFKKVNDTHGHMTGSGLLVKVAHLLSNGIRPTDWGVRYGGDEFVVILPTAGYAEAIIVAERLQNRLREEFAQDEMYKDISLSASFGVAVFSEDAETVEQLVAVADKAMYKAKELGRDRIFLAKDLKSE